MLKQHSIVKFQLPSHCSDEEKFDSNLTSASVQDVKELLCMKMKRFKEYLVRVVVIPFQTNVCHGLA